MSYERVIVEVSGSKIRQARKHFGAAVNTLKMMGVKPVSGLLLRRGYKDAVEQKPPTYPFLARLDEALIALGVTPYIAHKVIALGLKAITQDVELTPGERQFFYNFRKRAGADITWTVLPAGDIELRRGSLSLFVRRY